MQSEDRLQQDCVMWFRNTYPEWRGILYSVPNGGKRTQREAALLKSTGVFPGVSDLHLLTIYNGEPKIVFLEAKTKKGYQSKNQVTWQSLVEGMGFTYLLFRTLEEFKAIIIKYTHQLN